MNPTDSHMEYERDEFLSILTDLIAELRSPFFSMDPELDPVLDRAEARLREVTNE